MSVCELIHITINRSANSVTCKVEPLPNDTYVEIPQRVKVIWEDPVVEETTDLTFTYKPHPEIMDVYPKFTIARYALLFETKKCAELDVKVYKCQTQSRHKIGTLVSMLKPTLKHIYIDVPFFICMYFFIK